MLKGILHPEKGSVPFEDVLKECSDLAPAPILWNIIENQQNRGKMISASMIPSCLRKSYLQHKYDYYLPLQDLYWASFRGSLKHLSLALYAKGHNNLICEKRFSAPLDGVTFSGQIDAYDPEKQILYDYKTCKWIKPNFLPYGEHLFQTQIYSYLLSENNYPVEQIEIIYMDASAWARVILSSEKALVKYLEKNEWKLLTIKDLKLSPSSEIAEKTKNRIEILHRAFEEDIEPDPEPSYLCNLENREKKSYCPVRKFCSYWNGGGKSDSKLFE